MGVSRCQENEGNITQLHSQETNIFSKLASSLVDCMRASFYQDFYLSADQFAFSDPTQDGINFASNYMSNQEFLVYNR